MTAPEDKNMDELVALCKRRGFVYPASEIYGGLRGFWDYGPLGTALKNNIRDWWWRCMVDCPPIGPDGEPVAIVGLDSAIIQNPRVWEHSGHVGGFNDPMVDDKETKKRYRADHIYVFYPKNFKTEHKRFGIAVQASSREEAHKLRDELWESGKWSKVVFRAQKEFGFDPLEGAGVGAQYGDKVSDFLNVYGPNGEDIGDWDVITAEELDEEHRKYTTNLELTNFGTLTKPQMFNLMLDTYPGPIRDEDAKAYLRPETAQGIFLNFKNVLDTMRVKVPFGIAQIGKSFRNEVTPRNFIFRSREFEQMEMEFFCPPEDSQKWYDFWRDVRYKWWLSLGVAEENLILRDHDDDELAHYSSACVDVEYKYPFTAPGYGELEGVAHRGNYDLTAHSKSKEKNRDSNAKLDYFDQELQVKLQNEGVDKAEIKERSRYVPHVIEPASGLTRAVLVVLCEAFTPTPDREGSKYILSFKPKFAPIKAGVFPLVNKDGMPEVAQKLYLQLRDKWPVEYDGKQSIGKRYARMDEIGTPFCFTIDGDTLEKQLVTVRDRDTAEQETIHIDQVEAFLAQKLAE
ncbi:MAG: glycine--tRNA ligase [Phycisphaeraceae bacterium]|nr:glycine--tRNA ligase [Phycisphaeraceae bacterium]